MEIIKLTTTESTNSFLKNLVKNATPNNFTTIVAQKQTRGKGQQESNWFSEPNKNLTFSVFLSHENLKITHQKSLNFAISLAVYDVLFSKKISGISIKWPNDILFVDKKICGILIENTLSGGNIKNSIVGIGLNVNQEKFPKSLTKVTSLKLETLIEYDLDMLLTEVIVELQKKLQLLETQKYMFLEKRYLEVLYKKGTPSMFKNNRDEVFRGTIHGVSKNGKIEIQLDDNSIKEFGIKEVSFL